MWCFSFEMSLVPYREAVGCLVYLNVWTRLDISKATQETSQFSHNPGITHWAAVKQVHKCLNDTLDYGLTYASTRTGRLLSEAWSDADWASDLDSRRSVAAFVLTVSKAAMSWSSKQLPTICLSSAESEYGALSRAGREVLATRSTLCDLNQEQSTSTLISCDSQAAIALAKSARFHVRTQHIEVAFHFIRELSESSKVHVEYVASKDNLTDLLTKGLAKDRHFKLVHMLGLGLAQLQSEEPISR